MQRKTTQPTSAASLAEHHALALRAADHAESVLALFETVRPNDQGPRQAVEAARAWVRGELRMTEARRAAFAAHAAARAAGCPAACAAARAAGHAAATAHVPGHARHASAYARKALRIQASQPVA